jgi:hypothetical protein
MEEYNKSDRQEIFSKKIRAGKRTYFFDVKSTKGNDYLTETVNHVKTDLMPEYDFDSAGRSEYSNNEEESNNY